MKQYIFDTCLEFQQPYLGQNSTYISHMAFYLEM